MSFAPINKIIDFSTVDGPGCRTSIFVQACNIHCLYCHNPETQKLCFNCGKCVDFCPAGALSFGEGHKVVWDEEKCERCDTCINVCPSKASPKVKALSAEEVMGRIEKSLPFVRGITVSGGECSLYPDFLEELFMLAKKQGLTTLLDSNGMVDFESLSDLMNVVDGVMLDIKSWDSDVYQRLTGFDNVIVKKNLSYLSRIDKIEELRIVYVPGYVDAERCLEGIKETIGEKVESTRLKLITFRHNGVRSPLSNHPSPSPEEMSALKDYALKLGFKNIVIR
jgi:pyruvate formate lyase activating enzyme